MTGPNQATSGPYADPQPITPHDAFVAGLPSVVMVAARDAVLAMSGVQEAPEATHSPGALLTVDVGGVRTDIVIEVASKRHRPPGWSDAAKYTPGTVISVSDDGVALGTRSYWEVVEVLGTVADPRPGYRLRHTGRTEQGGFSRMLGDGRETIVPPQVEGRSTREGVAA